MIKKVSGIFTQSIFLQIWIKQSLSFFAVKFEAQGSFLLGDMGAFIRPCSTFRCMGQQKLGDLFMCYVGQN